MFGQVEMPEIAISIYGPAATVFFCFFHLSLQEENPAKWTDFTQPNGRQSRRRDDRNRVEQPQPKRIPFILRR